MFKKLLTGGSVAAVLLAGGLAAAHADNAPTADDTKTPIKHVVVIFSENISFDHYFGTYPNAENPAGETPFHAKTGTPSVNGLNDALLTQNPNSLNPVRLPRSRPVTCSQGHGYGAEQKAYDKGLMDRFVEFTAGGGTLCPSPIVMDYYDGNTVTGMWNLAQNFSLNDNSFSTNFGPSTVGAINLISGQTHGTSTADASGSIENGTVIGDPEPAPDLDDCANGSAGARMTGQNVGDLMNAKNVTWGWFQGGFAPSSTDGTGKAHCADQHQNVAGASINDYSAHHAPFMYYPSTANPHHTRPANIDEIGHDGQANHEYDIDDFNDALDAGKLPQVSYLKANAYEDGHPSNSDPIDEQRFIARELNRLQASDDWRSTAVIIAYDDSDGWYDHQMSPIVNGSNGASDAITAAGQCGTLKNPSDPTSYNDRCGYGTRQPLLVISPFAKQNYVDHTLTDQTSILKFVEDNWKLGRIGDNSFDARAGTIQNMFDFDAPTAPKIFLDEETGEVTRVEPTAPPVIPPTVTVTTPGQTVTTPGQTVTTPGQTVTNTVTVPGKTTTTSGGGNSGNASNGSTPGGSHGSTPTKGSKGAKVVLRCTTSGGGKRIAVSCIAKGKAPKVTTGVRVRLMNGKSVLATSAGKLVKGRVHLTLRPKHAAKKGSYTLTVTVTQPGSVSAQHQTIHI